MMRDIYENLLNLGFEDLIGSKLGTPKLNFRLERLLLYKSVKNSIKTSSLAPITKTSSLYHVQKRTAWGHCQCQSHSLSLPISYTGSFNFRSFSHLSIKVI